MEVTSQSNPLLIPIILDEIFTHLGHKDLKTCNKVCKLWKTAALRFWTLRSIFPYLSLEELKICRLVSKKWSKVALESMVLKSVVKIGTYEKAQECLEIAPKFNFTSLQFKTNIDISHDTIQQLCQVLSQHITYLDLRRAKWLMGTLRKLLLETLPNLTHLTIISGMLPGTRSLKGPKAVESDRFDLSRVRNLYSFFDSNAQPSPKPYLPKIKYLRLDMNIVNNTGQPRPGVKNFLLDIFQCVPNLEHFWWDGSDNRLAREFIVDFILETPSIQWPKLTRFMACGNEEFLNTKRMKLMQAKKFPLKGLRIRIKDRTTTAEDLHEFIISFSETLNSYLGLVYLNEGSPCNEFPRMTSALIGKNITSLELWSYGGTFDFLIDFFNLKRLQLIHIDLSSFEIHENPLPPNLFQSLRKVLLRRCHGEMPIDYFSQLPSLTIEETDQ